MTGETQDKAWNLPKFYFQVKIAGQEAPFQEVSGLDMETQTIEYRHGNSPEFSTIKMPGIRKTGMVTLKKGIFKGNNTFWDWVNQIKINIIERKTVTISLLDERGNDTIVWTLKNAWPTKITGTERVDDNEITVETLEIAHEGMTIANL